MLKFTKVSKTVKLKQKLSLYAHQISTNYRSGAHAMCCGEVGM